MGGFSYVLSLRAMSQMADLMGDRNASARYGSLATKATAEFHSIFWNAGQQRYGGDPGAIQSLSLPALDIGAPPTAALHSTVVKTLRDDLVTNTNYTLRVGAVGSAISCERSTEQLQPVSCWSWPMYAPRRPMTKLTSGPLGISSTSTS